MISSAALALALRERRYGNLALAHTFRMPQNSLAEARRRAQSLTMKIFSVYLLSREQPVEIKADWFALVTDKDDPSYRFKVKTEEGSEVVGETPARNLLLIVEKDAVV